MLKEKTEFLNRERLRQLRLIEMEELNTSDEGRGDDFESIDDEFGSNARKLQRWPAAISDLSTSKSNLPKSRQGQG